MGSKESYTKAKELDTKGNYERESLRDLAWYKPLRATKASQITPQRITPGLQRSLT